MQTFKTTCCTVVVRDARMHKHTAHYSVTITMGYIPRMESPSYRLHEFLKSAEHVHVHVYVSCVVNVQVRECMHACRCVCE